MKNTKQVAIVVLTALLVIQLSVFVIAEEVETTGQAPFSFTSWFQHTFGTQQFSIVGDSQQCDKDATWTFATTGGDEFKGDADDYCSSGHGLWDVYSPGWNPWKEFKDSVHVICNPNNQQCNFELYCCDNPEPSSNSNCQNWYGSYSQMKSANCVSWNGGYKCTTDYGTESSIPYSTSSFKYCTSNIGVDCYYYPGSGSSCSKKTYPGTTDCPWSYEGNLLYTSKSQCENNIPVQCNPQNSKKCYNGDVWWYDSCNVREIKAEECGSNSCVNGACVPGDEGGEDETGDDETNGEVEYIDKEDDPDVLAKISEFSISKNTANPGDQVEVKFKVTSTQPWDSWGWNPIAGNKADGLYIEAGIIPKSVRDEWFPESPTGFFALGFKQWFQGDNLQDECCDGQPNVQGGPQVFNFNHRDEKYSIKTNVPDELTTDLCPVNGVETNYWNPNSEEYYVYVVIKNKCFKDGGRSGVYAIKPLNVNVNTSGIENPSGAKRIGERCVDNFECLSGICEKEGLFSYKRCRENPDATAISEGNLGLKNLKKISLTEQQISESTSVQLLASSCKMNDECLQQTNTTVACISIAKLREDGIITEADEENFFKEGKTIVRNGVIGGALGGAGGLALCALGVFGATGATVATGGTATPLLIPAAVSCTSIASAGALIGAGTSVGGTILWNDLMEDDDLIDALKAGDASGIGICTAKEEKSFDVGSFLSDLGKKVKITGNETTDGLLLVGGAFILIMIILGMLGGKR